MSTWNEFTESLLRRWSKRCHTYSLLHSLSADYFSSWNKRLGIPLVVLGGATSSSIFASSQDSNHIMTYINGSLVFLMTGLIGVSKFLSLDENQVKHQSASFKYLSIVMNIDTILTFPRSERQYESQEFVSMMKSSILEVRENSPEVLSWIKADLIKNFDESLTKGKVQVNKETGIAYVSDKKSIRPESPSVSDSRSRSRSRYISRETPTKLLPEFLNKPKKIIQLELTPSNSDSDIEVVIEDPSIKSEENNTWFSAIPEEHIFSSEDPQVDRLCSTFYDSDGD
jgi:hypothetical protein